MADIRVTSTCEEGYAVSNVIDDEWKLTVDALQEAGPDPNQVLAADYASCYVPALRVAADQQGYDGLGEVEVDVQADIDEDDDLAAVSFDIRVEADVSGDEDALIAQGEEICHVHSALREGLHADISLEGDAV